MSWIAAVDQSTSATKAYLVDERGGIARAVTLRHRQYYPAPGRVEHDAQEIYENLLRALEQIVRDVPTDQIAALALTNQRETSVLWERGSGRPVCPAIVWQDVRGESACRELAKQAPLVHEITGLTLSPYFQAGKLRALFQENPDLYARARRGELCLGTVDSYLVYRLSGGRHLTDTSNASRTQLMNLRTLEWSDELCRLFGIPREILPEEILPADADFGMFRGIPIRGVLGDSHAALYGQGCHAPGMAKATYGTGSSVMMNVGGAPVISKCGLSASVGFSAGGKTCYALEGNVTCSADTLVWLCRELELFKNETEIEALAATVEDAGGAALVPAFAGLGAPHFDSDARALICGLNRGTTRAQIARAALESIAQQDADILERMRAESGYDVRCLYADGGPTKNALLMQLQADLADCRVTTAAASELSALGAAYIAGIRSGVYSDFADIPARATRGCEYEVKMDDARRAALRDTWKKAIQRTRDQ